MKVVILCGGRGTRLREETEFRPKPMVPIGGKPILWHIMKIYATHGFKEFILCLGYKGEMIKDYFRNYLWMTSDVTLRLGREPEVHFHNHHGEEDWKVTLVDTGLETMTAGRIARIEPHLGEDSEFLFTYGDGVGDIPIGETIRHHHKQGRLLTLTAVRPPGRFGELRFGPGGEVREFNEKPQVEEGRINGGFFVASRKIFNYLGNSDRLMFEREPIQHMVREGQVAAFPHDGFWHPMDTYYEFNLLNQLWAENRAPWKIWSE